MININRKIFSGRNVTIINGKVVNGGKKVKSQKFDERKCVDINNVEKIVIDSSVADVNISASNSSKIEVHFYGQAEIDGNIDFDVNVANRELRITLKIEDTCYSNGLKLDISIPHKNFKAIVVNSLSADIILGEGVSTEYLEVETLSGDLETNATFTNTSINTMHGDIDLFIEANNDIAVEITTMNGDISAEFNNIDYIDLSTTTMNGDVKNRHKRGDGYTANVYVTTMNGDIKIR